MLISVLLYVVQVEVKLVIKSWSDLYINFVRLSAMVANTEPNIACEQLMSRVYSFTKPLTTDVCMSLCLSVCLSLCCFCCCGFSCA